MRLFLVLLGIFLQSFFDFFNVQQLLGLYALHNIRRRRILALAALYQHRQIRRRRNRRLRRYWCLPRPAGSWFEIHCNDRRIPDEYFKQQL